MVSWEFFCKRRGLSLGSVIDAFGLNSYEDLHSWCKARGIQSPEKDEFKSYLAAKTVKVKEVAKKVVKKTSPAAEPVKKKPAPRKRSRKSRNETCLSAGLCN